jgi:hypothetical protein
VPAIDRIKGADERDFTIAREAGRLSSTADVRPKHVRLIGVAYLLSALMCLLWSYNDINFSARVFPKLLTLGVTLPVYAGWLLVDAKALASGRRRHQRVIQICLVGGGLVLSFVVLEGLTRGW